MTDQGHLTAAAKRNRPKIVPITGRNRFNLLTEDLIDLFALQNAFAQHRQDPELSTAQLAALIGNAAGNLGQAVAAKDSSGIADALMDNLHITLSAVLLLGLPVEALWAAIHVQHLRRSLDMIDTKGGAPCQD